MEQWDLHSATMHPPPHPRATREEDGNPAPYLLTLLFPAGSFDKARGVGYTGSFQRSYTAQRVKRDCAMKEKGHSKSACCSSTISFMDGKVVPTTNYPRCITVVNATHLDPMRCWQMQDSGNKIKVYLSTVVWIPILLPDAFLKQHNKQVFSPTPI